MSGRRSTVVRRLLFAAPLILLSIFASTPCSYFGWRREKAEQRAELRKSPGGLVLEKNDAPRYRFGLIGRVAIPKVGYGDTHVGILSDASVLEELRRLLGETSRMP